ncbi:MAG: tyrosine-type recombinase/integrase [Candidatus Methanoperedens sp.]|nr:tyrosine-type recombinase/integrase [Candidatus Methanoperedens sp.]
MQKLEDLEKNLPQNTNGKSLLTDQPLLDRGMNLEECKVMCTSSIIPLREKVFFRIIYESQFRPDEVLNLLIENWDRQQHLVTAVKVKQKTAPVEGDRHKKVHLLSRPRTAILTDNTNEMLRTIVSNRKKGFIFVNEKGKRLSMAWFKTQINHYAKLLGFQKATRYYNEKNNNPDKVHPRYLVTCMALREAGERHHDNAGGSRKLSAVSAGHTMAVKEQHYEKVGEDFEQVHQSMKKFHPAFVEGW